MLIEFSALYRISYRSSLRSFQFNTLPLWHRYEVNNHYLPRLEATGLVVGARAKSEAAGDLCEMIELVDHPWFFGCQFHPEFTSNPRRGHPLFVSFVRAALEQQRTAGASAAAVAELVASI